MSANWIKIEKATANKREILIIADELSIPRDQALGLCFRFWTWIDENLESCHARSVTPKLINSMLGHEGFAEAMIRVGWLEESGGGIEVPNFDRHLSQGSKNRSLTTERQIKKRKAVTLLSRFCHDPSVTKALPDKIRLDKNIIDREKEYAGATDSTKPQEILPQPSSQENELSQIAQHPLCSLEQALSHAATCRMAHCEAEHWWHVRNGSGWTKGSAGGGAARKITSWQSDMATSASWAKEAISKNRNSKTDLSSSLKSWEV